MIGIVKLFPIETFLTREFTLFVWNDKLNNICVRVFLQKREVVMNEVFTKIVRLCVEAKKSRWETSCRQLWIQHWLHSKWWPGRDVCKLKDNKVWVVHVLNWEKVPVEKRSCFEKRAKKLGNRIMNTTICFWELLDDLMIWYCTSISCSSIYVNIGPLQPTDGQ